MMVHRIKPLIQRFKFTSRHLRTVATFTGIPISIILLLLSYGQFLHQKNELASTAAIYNWIVEQPIPDEEMKLPSQKEFLNIVLHSASAKGIAFNQIHPRNEQPIIVCNILDVEFAKIILWIDELLRAHPYIDVSDFTAYSSSNSEAGMANISLTLMLDPVGAGKSRR